MASSGFRRAPVDASEIGEERVASCAVRRVVFVEDGEPLFADEVPEGGAVAALVTGLDDPKRQRCPGTLLDLRPDLVSAKCAVILPPTPLVADERGRLKRADVEAHRATGADDGWVSPRRSPASR